MNFRYSLLVILILFLSCKKTSPVTVVPTAPEPDLYIAGDLSRPNGFSYGVTWKNGEPTVLPDSSQPLSLSFTVNDLYVLGSSGLYFRNSAQPSVQPSYVGYAIAALGTDVYITRRIQDDVAAIYWKNGQIIYLTTVSGLVSDAISYGIFISDIDIYITGTISEYPDFQPKAVYWKNGQITYLKGGSVARFITVSGNNVYAAGQAYARDVYWINGQIHSVGVNDNLTGIAVSGNDVYLSGINLLAIAPGRAFYYKNDQKIILPGGYVSYGIGVNASDVYSVGRDSANNAVYWKNTDKHILGVEGVARCILVENK